MLALGGNGSLDKAGARVYGIVLRTHHIYLIVERAETVSPRYWREQFYDHLSEMSSEAIKPAHAGLHGQARTCISRRDLARRLESSRNLNKVARKFTFRGIFANIPFCHFESSHFANIPFCHISDFLKINHLTKFKNQSESCTGHSGKLLEWQVQSA